MNEILTVLVRREDWERIQQAVAGAAAKDKALEGIFYRVTIDDTAKRREHELSPIELAVCYRAVLAAVQSLEPAEKCMASLAVRRAAHAAYGRYFDLLAIFGAMELPESYL